MTKQQAMSRFMALAQDDPQAALKVLREYDLAVATNIPGHRVAQFAVTVKAEHIRVLLRRLETVALS